MTLIGKIGRAGAVVVAVVSGFGATVAGAAPNAAVNHANTFAKITENCSASVGSAPHFNSDFNPSLVNQFLNGNPACGKLVDVIAGAQPL